MAWLSAALTITDDGVAATKTVPTLFDIDNAIGKQLDTLGEIVGRSRKVDFQPTDGSSPELDDANFRLIIKTKIATNQWDGTISQIRDLWANIFEYLMLVIVDNQDMSISLGVVGLSTPLEKDLIANGYILPKPAGVRANFSFYDDAIFGYDLDNSAIKGYDEGYWFQAYPLFAYDISNSQLKGYDEGEWA
ncbi:DUF2612 domain-containing protein [Paenibacillus sp. S3N08]|uniref:DUF2612 domain-containing protein n=2 Tax=Paenibacillus agricola TaxID=2716264 RepID=A0ABX0JCS3_9BACL|nr:DUF2612 domain-containing protein [Paenibacillus agricola]